MDKNDLYFRWMINRCFPMGMRQSSPTVRKVFERRPSGNASLLKRSIS